MQNGANLHPTLQRGQLQRDARGFPMVASGSFSSAYRFRFPNGNHVAVRVFHPPPQAADRAKVDVWRARYAKLQRHFDSIRVPAEIVEVRWIDDGIRVDGRSLPVTVMPWVEAQGLDDWMAGHVGRPEGARALAGFASSWRRAMGDLRAAKLAHGDLHHGNVLIERQSGAMRFIDYDAMWAPTLAGTANDEIGHPHYQHPSYFHPQTRARAYGPELDRFSALVVYVTAKALEHDPSLWQRFHRADDHLVFTHDDYRNPAASPVFQAIAASPSQTVRKLGQELARACRAAPEQTPELERAIAAAGGGGAAGSPQARPQRPWYQGR
jgi:hypothetical protein